VERLKRNLLKGIRGIPWPDNSPAAENIQARILRLYMDFNGPLL
jgi:hypothetical protein